MKKSFKLSKIFKKKKFLIAGSFSIVCIFGILGAFSFLNNDIKSPDVNSSINDYEKCAANDDQFDKAFQELMKKENPTIEDINKLPDGAQKNFIKTLYMSENYSSSVQDTTQINK